MPTSAKSPDSKPRIAADPKSPFFARVAAEYLGEGRTREALALCLEGTKVFPRYATGSLILGKCYEALGRNAEAIMEYRRVLAAFPDNAAVNALMQRAEQLESEAYQRFAESLEPALSPRKDMLTFSEFATGTQQVQSNTVEFLIKQLQQAPKLQRSATTPMLPVVPEDLTATGEPTPVIVTETLAEIYASQGQFREAIQAYKTLAAQKPGDEGRYAERIAQLEELVRLGGETGTQ